jgi:hypothetical protein
LNTYLTISANIQQNLNLSEQLQWVIGPLHEDRQRLRRLRAAVDAG